MPISKAFRYSPCVTTVCYQWHSFTCHSHPNYICLYSPAHKASPPFGCYSLHLPTKGWPGWVDLGGWLHTEMNVRHRELNPDMVMGHPSQY